MKGLSSHSTTRALASLSGGVQVEAGAALPVWPGHLLTSTQWVAPKPHALTESQWVTPKPRVQVGAGSALPAWPGHLLTSTQWVAPKPHALTESQWVTPKPKACDTTRPKVVRPQKLPTTPLQAVGNNMHAKLEGAHAGGSIKDRAVGHCVFGMLSSGQLKPGGTLALCTSGSAGVSVLHAQQDLLKKGIAINVKIFMPRAYLSKAEPRKIAGSDGVELIDAVESREASSASDSAVATRELCPLDGLFVDVLGRMKELAQERDWAILDQHYDVNGALAHENTAREIMDQLPGVTDVVCTTGTGATAAGLRKFLPWHVTVHARPAESGGIAGLCDVRRYANFCDTDLLEGYTEGFFDPSIADEHKAELESVHSIETGPSGGATFSLAKDIANANSYAQVVFICADGKPSTLATEQHSE